MLVGHVAKASLRLNGVGRKIVPRDNNLAKLIGMHSRYALDSRGFTRAVVTEYADNLTAVADNVNILYGIVCPCVIFFCKTFNLDMLVLYIASQILAYHFGNAAVHSFVQPYSPW